MSSLIKIDFHKPAIGFMNGPIFLDKPDVTLAWCLGQTILGPFQGGDAATLAKIILWIGDLEREELIEVDEVEFKKLYSMIENSQQTAMLRGRLLEAMDKAKAQKDG